MLDLYVSRGHYIGESSILLILELYIIFNNIFLTFFFKLYN